MTTVSDSESDADRIREIRYKEMKGIIGWKDVTKQRAKYIVEDVNRILSERDGEEVKKTEDDMSILDFVDFQNDHASLHNIQFEWWNDFVKIHEYLERYAQENDNVIIIVWNRKKKMWEEALSLGDNEDGIEEYTVDDTVVIQITD